MNSADAEQLLFADTLVCDDEFPVTVRPAHDHQECLDCARRAEVTLRALASVEESHTEEADPAEHVNARIEAKLDLAFALLAMIASHQRPPPPVRRVRWSRLGLRVAVAEPLAPAAAVVVSACLLSGFPLPVDLPLEVLACESSDHGFDVWLRIPEYAPAVRTGIERELFRHHRRLIAERRSAR